MSKKIKRPNWELMFMGLPVKDETKLRLSEEAIRLILAIDQLNESERLRIQRVYGFGD